MYSRVINDTVLTLSASGWTYGSRFVLYDKETESMWFAFDDENGLRCVSGHFADEILQEEEYFFGDWNTWNAVHPYTLFLNTK